MRARIGDRRRHSRHTERPPADAVWIRRTVESPCAPGPLRSLPGGGERSGARRSALDAGASAMNLLRRLFGGGGGEAIIDNAIHLYVRCNRCNAPVHVRVDPRNDLVIEYGDDEDASGYRLIKEIMDSRCFRLMRAEIEYDRARRELNRQIEGGTFISREEYDQLATQDGHERKN